MFRLVSIKPLPGYNLKVVFNDGFEGVFPVEPEKRGGVFLKLLEPEIFNAVKLNADFGCAEWPGGVDLCPTTMHEQMVNHPVQSSA